MKKIITRAALLALAALVAPLALAQSAADYPQHPVHLVVPFPPGGATDVIARLIAQKLSAALGQTVVVENKSGATGAIGSVYVAKAAPDGYTLLMGTASTHSVAPAVNPRLPYDNLKDFAPISLVATFPNMLVVNPSIPAKTVPEFIQYLKKHPGKVNFASTGVGGSVHLTAELFKMATKTDMVHIPYKGSSEALTELVAGRVQVEFDNMTTVWPYVQAGKLRALGVASLTRSPEAPDVPTIAETVPGFDATSWVGLFAPAGTPAAILDKVAADTRAVLKQPYIVQRLARLGATAAGSDPQAFGTFVRKDTEKWRSVAAAAHIKL